MSERRSVVKVMAGRYRKATKKQKGGMLDELIALSGYNRRCRASVSATLCDSCMAPVVSKNAIEV